MTFLESWDKTAQDRYTFVRKWPHVKVTCCSRYVMLHIRRCISTRQAQRHQVHVCSSFQSWATSKNCRWPRLATDDLYEGHRVKFAPGSSTILKYNSIHDKMIGSDAYRRDLAFFPLPYNGEVTKLTWPQVTEIKNPRYTFWSYQ